MMWRLSPILFLLLLGGCSESPKQPYPYTEMAMSKGMVINATNANGHVSIDWIDPLTRKYAWEKYEETRTLIPRKTRFMKKLGAYDPASQFIFCIICPITIVADDSMIDFSSTEELYAFLYQGSAVLDWVYNDDGWVVGFGKTPDRKQVNISVYKITVNGSTPSVIKGSRNHAIQITYK